MQSNQRLKSPSYYERDPRFRKYGITGRPCVNEKLTANPNFQDSGGNECISQINNTKISFSQNFEKVVSNNPSSCFSNSTNFNSYNYYITAPVNCHPSSNISSYPTEYDSSTNVSFYTNECVTSNNSSYPSKCAPPSNISSYPNECFPPSNIPSYSTEYITSANIPFCPTECVSTNNIPSYPNRCTTTNIPSYSNDCTATNIPSYSNGCTATNIPSYSNGCTATDIPSFPSRFSSSCFPNEDKNISCQQYENFYLADQKANIISYPQNNIGITNNQFFNAQTIAKDKVSGIPFGGQVSCSSNFSSQETASCQKSFFIPHNTNFLASDPNFNTISSCTTTVKGGNCIVEEENTKLYITADCNFGKNENITQLYESKGKSRKERISPAHQDRSRTNSKSSNNRKRLSRSRTRSRSRSRSKSRTKSRSRSRSRQRRSYSRSRTRSPSRSRYRYKERSPPRNKYNYKYGRRYRSRSRSRSRSRISNRSRSQRSRSPDKKKRRSRDREIGSRNVYKQPEGDRQKLIEKWRMNNCDTQDEMQKRLKEISLMNPDEILEEENKIWIRSAPADCYYKRDENDLRRMRATPRLNKLCERFKHELLERGNRVRQSQTLQCPAPVKPKQKLCKHKSQECFSSDYSGSENSYDSDDENDIIEELQRKQKHPYRLHPELWYNDPGEMNDGPLCRCSAKARRSGIRHGFYAGENERSYCDQESNNAGNLYHYRITISPPTNFLTKTPTIINHDDHEFIFEGFSLISHYPIQKLPTCKVIRFNIEYIILYVEESLPENFCIKELDLFYNYLFKEILELVDFDLYNPEFPDSCPQFHFMPRFVRELPERGRELLPMCEVLKYLLQSNKKLIEDDTLDEIDKMSNTAWQNFADLVKGMVVTNPGMKPCSLRVDQLDRDTDEAINENNKDNIRKKSSYERSLPEKDFIKDVKEFSTLKTKDSFSFSNGLVKTELKSECDLKPLLENSNTVSSKKFYPEIVHFGIRPPQLSYAGNPEYQKAWRKYVKFRHLLANMPKPTAEDKQKLAAKESRLHSMRAHSKMKRDVTVTVSSKGFYLTGLMCDVVQHAMLIPVLVCHLRFHQSLAVLENKIDYKFKNRFLLQLALTHPSYRENFGTNADHARNSLTNCGIRQPTYGDRRIHYMNTRKRGINTLISIMSQFGKKSETQSNIYHNERLEFLGDAVVEFVTSIHLFHIFRDLEEGGLATYRAALVQNQHLAVLAKKLHLDEFMLYAHGSDLCHDLELKHAMANCFEALMGALFLDGGIETADKVFGNTLYGDDEDCLDVWFNYPPHPLQEQEPLGDRRWIPQFPLLQKLTEFEEATGIEFKHIRLLARAFTDRSVGYTNLTLGSNQRLEFLGDSVLQLIASEYLYKYFPEHHEGHLSLLRSSLVNNKTQSVVCDDLGMTKYAVYANPKSELKIKDRADLLEAFLGALYVDSGVEICRVFCDVCFFPRLQVFIMNQDWNDPKSKLQQCCLTLRTMDNVEPDIPIYKVVECKGPTNTRVYTVAVYFRNKRLAKATGHSIQQAEMNAALKAMQTSGPLFPQLDHQKRVIEKSLKTQKWPNRISWSSESFSNVHDKSSTKKKATEEVSD